MGRTFEYIINHVGGFSKFQVYMICAVFGMKFFAAWSMMQMAFAGIIPDFHCLTDDTTNLYALPNDRQTAIVADVNKTLGIDTFNQCRVNGSTCIEYQFDTSIRGIINEWDLVCDLSWVKATTTSVQMAGVLLGAVLSGYLGDLYGRKKTNYGFYLFHCLCNVAILFANSWHVFMVFRFLIGMGIDNFVPESIRWLTVKGRTEEAYKVFEQMAAINGKVLPDDTVKVIQIVADEERRIRENGKNYSYVDIFHGQGMVFNTLSFAFTWISLSMVGYGLGFGVSGLGGNVYLTLFLLYAIEVPITMSSFFFSNRFGRRKTTAMFFFIGAVAGFGAMTVKLTEPESNRHILTSLTLVAKCAVGAAWVTSQSWVIEIYPTVTRNLGYGFVNMWARVGGIIAPFAIDLDSRLVLSYTLIGAFLLISTILAMLCKETKGMVLADSIAINVDKPTAVNGKDTSHEISHPKGEIALVNFEKVSSK